MSKHARPLIADVGSAPDLPDLVHRLHLRPAPVVIVIGGASEFTEDLAGSAESVVAAIVAAVHRNDATVVDGGTDAGVMRLMGRARASGTARFDLVGVVPITPLSHSGSGVEPNHSHIIRVPGEHWGDETATLFDLAEQIASGRPIVTVLINGGTGARVEAEQSVRRGHHLIAIAGTGRAADAIALAAQGSTADADAARIVALGAVDSVNVSDHAGLESRLDAVLSV